MMNDALDDILTESGDEEEEDAIVNQVLDEIGIEISGKMKMAPDAGKDELGALDSDVDIAKKLADLK